MPAPRQENRQHRRARERRAAKGLSHNCPQCVDSQTLDDMLNELPTQHKPRRKR